MASTKEAPRPAASGLEAPRPTALRLKPSRPAAPSQRASRRTAQRSENRAAPIPAKEDQNHLGPSAPRCHLNLSF